jgi:uncharacterized protein involved in exopolysaccharide biosynthesis
MTIHQILHTIKKWFWLIPLGAVISGALAALLSFVWSPTYESEALLLITKLRPEITLDPRFATVTEENLVNLSIQEDQVRRQTLVGLVDSADLMQQVIDRLGDTLRPHERSVAALSSMVEARTEGNLIALLAKASDPERAAAIANAWADVYQETVNRLYSATSPSGAQVQAQLQAAEVTYDASAQAVEDFIRVSKENELARLIGQKKQILDDLQKSHLGAARTRTDDLLARLAKIDQLVLDARSLRQKLAGSPAAGPLTAGEQVAMLAVESGAYTDAEMLPLTLELGAGWTAESPLTVQQASERLGRLVETLAAARASTQTELDSLVSTLLSGQEILNNGTQDTASYIADLQTAIDALEAELEQQQITRSDLVDARDVAQQNFLTLVRKADEVQILSQLTSVEVQKAAAARPPENPAFPQPLMTTALGVLAGGLAGLALAFVLELWPRGGEHLADGR